MELLLYNFTKRANSTAIPSGEPDVRLNVALKSGDVSKHSPVLELEHPLSRLYDYAYFDSTWYWVRDFAFNDYQYYTLQLEIDVLATYRDWIMDTPNYCLRSSVLSNGKIIDSYQPVEYVAHKITQYSKFLDAVSPDQGWPIINLLGTQGTRCYNVEQNGVEEICNALFSQKQSDLWDVIKGAFTNELTQMINLTGYINDVYYLPFNPATRGSYPMRLGYFDTGVSGKVMAGIAKEGTVIIPLDHPASTTFEGTTSYQRGNKYVSYMLRIPCCGVYEIDADKVADENSIAIVYYVDCYGNIGGVIKGGESGDTLQYFNGYCAFRYSVGQQQSSTFNQVASKAVASAMTFNAGGAESALASIVPIAGTIIGGSGNAADWRIDNGQISLTMFWKNNASGLSPSVNGYPVYNMVTPSTPGYYLFKDAHIAAGEAWENQEIERYLNSGIFIE